MALENVTGSVTCDECWRSVEIDLAPGASADVWLFAIDEYDDLRDWYVDVNCGDVYCSECRKDMHL